MTISTYIVLEMHESRRCASCDRPLATGDTVSELDGRPFCGAECAFEFIGRAMARLHGAEQNGEKDVTRQSD